jgi:hypothetical protein
VSSPPAGWENMPTALSCANADDCWVAMSTYDSSSAAGAYSEPTIEATHDGRHLVDGRPTNRSAADCRRAHTHVPPDRRWLHGHW